MSRVIRRLRRIHADEGGAVLLIVVFALLALVGMLALVFDLGSLASTRRTAVKAADAAALAAAQSCFDGDAAGAPVAAQQVGLANMQDSGAALSAEATAAWGMVVGPPVPIMASIGGPNAFSSCDIPDPTAGSTCYVLMDNDNNGGGEFGYLSLTDWYPVGTDPVAMDCSAAGGTNLIRDEIAGISMPRYVYGAPAWSCKVPGESAQTWPTLAGLTRWFPLTNPAVTEPSGKFYYVQGFAQATVVSVEQKSWSDVATDPGAGDGGTNGDPPPTDTTQQTCGNAILVPPNGSYSCIGLTWHTSLMPTPGNTAIAEGVHLIK
jgi:hypothetical protein